MPNLHGECYEDSSSSITSDFLSRSPRWNLFSVAGCSRTRYVLVGRINCPNVDRWLLYRQIVLPTSVPEILQWLPICRTISIGRTYRFLATNPLLNCSGRYSNNGEIEPRNFYRLSWRWLLLLRYAIRVMSSRCCRTSHCSGCCVERHASIRRNWCQ